MTDQIEFEPAPVVPTVTAKKRNPLDMILVGAAVVALAGVAFATGRLTAPAAAAATTVQTGAVTGANGQTTTGQNGGRVRGSFDPNASFVPGQGFAGGQGGALGGAAAGLTLSGTVTAITADSITLKLDNGTEITIPIQTSTTYHQSTTTTNATVKSGLKVEVRVTGGAGALRQGGQQGGASPAPGASAGTQTFGGTATDITIIP